MYQFLAKSSGITLTKHCSDVSRFGVAIASKSLITIEPLYVEAVRISGLLHDIGKCTVNFQKKLKIKKFNDDEDSIEYKLPFRHNEVGWAFLSRNLKLKSELLDLVLDAVYWHHGISNEMGKYSDYDVKYSDEDSDKMMEYLKSVMPEECIVEKEYKHKKAPAYYVSEGIDPDYTNMIKTLIRTCIISADRLISASDEVNFTDDDINDIIEK